VAWGRAAAWEDVLAQAERLGVAAAAVDYGYEMRAAEVFGLAGECRNATGQQWIIPCKGVDKTSLELDVIARDPDLGRAGAGRQTIQLCRFRVDTFRLRLLALMRGEHRNPWRVYDGIEAAYAGYGMTGRPYKNRRE
jgi:hypothetical protein